MIRRLRQIFARYADRHTTLTGDSQPLLNGNGDTVGNVDRVAVQDGRLVLDGWADARRVSLSQNGLQAQVHPDLARTDVVASHTDLRTPRPGFQISLPYRAGPVALALDNGADVQVFSVPAFDAARVRRVRRRYLVPFLLRCVATVPLALRYRLSRDPARGLLLRQRIKTRLGLKTEAAETQTRVMDARLLADPNGLKMPMGTQTSSAVTIILPVYNAFDLVRECVDRVARHTDVPWHLVVIEDCSTDADVRPWLADWVAKTNAVTPGRVTLIENPENRGFIRSVNSGFDVAVQRGDHVVLLNSDALVPQDWASRLIAPLNSEPDAASVTPMSNDAEIFGAPVMCAPVALSPGEADIIDRTAATFEGEASIVEAPTGVGFCMAIHIDYLRLHPAFDTAFGRGYGEEVDWCQKVRASGGSGLKRNSKVSRRLPKSWPNDTNPMIVTFRSLWAKTHCIRRVWRLRWPGLARAQVHRATHCPFIWPTIWVAGPNIICNAASPRISRHRARAARMLR